MKTIHKKRLERLAEHLERGKLKHDEWDFGYWHISNCKSAGCAFGEAAMLWPRHLKFRLDFEHVVSRRRIYDIEHIETGAFNYEAAEEFFGLTTDEALALFTQTAYAFSAPDPVPRGLCNLRHNATPKQVAANIRRLLKMKENGK